MGVASVLVFTILATAAVAREFQFRNLLPGPIWVGSQGSIGKPALNGGGWLLNAGEQMSIHTQDDWGGRFWARTWCDPKTNHCETGDCGNQLQCRGVGGAPPATLAEFTLKGWGGLDYYEISLIDGFNVATTINAYGGQSDGSPYSCQPAACKDLNPSCPSELQLRGAAAGYTIGCKSACQAFNGTDQYCCTGAHDRPETCRSSDWPKDYAKFFKNGCPDAFSYLYDDRKNLFTCNAPAYRVTFG